MQLRKLPIEMVRNYVKNYVRLKQGKRDLDPYFTTLYVTLRCNYSCSFCDDGRQQKYPESKVHELGTKETKRLLQIVRTSSPSIYFTGGEPFLRRDILELCRYARNLKFYPISINTNGSLLHHNVEVLANVDNLIVSLFTMDPDKYSQTIQRSPRFFDTVMDNILAANELRRQKGLELTVNSVISKDSIKDNEAVMDFCFEQGINFSVVPAVVGFYPQEGLDCAEYREFIYKVIASKREGKPVFNSYECLEIIRDFRNYNCHPLLTPHIYPDGSLFYPCQLLTTSVDLLEIGDYRKAISEARKSFGEVPNCDNRCHMACYIEPSIVTESVLNLRHLLTL